MEKIFEEYLKDNFVVEVFGEPYSSFNLKLDKEKLPIPKDFEGSLSLVKVLGFKYMGACLKLSEPKLLLLPGAGGTPTGCGFEEGKNVKMWKVGKDYTTLDLSVNRINILDVVESEGEKRASLSVKIKDPQYSSGVFTGKIQIKIDLGVFRITENIPIRVTIVEGGEVVVFNENVSGADIVITLKLPALNKACANVSVSYMGFRMNDNVCVTF